MDPADLIMIEPEDCERYQLADGNILHIGRYDHIESMGFLEVFPGKEVKWAIPVAGFLKQTEGAANLTFLQGETKLNEAKLETGQRHELEPNAQFAIRNNGTIPSLTFFKYRGNAEQIFLDFTKSLPHLPYEAREKSAYKNMYQQHTQVRDEYAERNRPKEEKKGFFSRFRKK